MADILTIDEIDEAYNVYEEAVNEPELSVDQIVQNKISKSVRTLKEILSKQFATEKGDQSTNIINVAERRTYNLPDTHLDEFFHAMDACRKESRMLHYSERQETSEKESSGIMIDFDRYQKSKEPEINNAHFDKLAVRIGNILLRTLQIDVDHCGPSGEWFFHLFVIRKPAVVLQDASTAVYKDGFHMLIPDIWVRKGVKKYLLQEMIRTGVMKSTFRDIPHIEEPEKMLDMMSASNPVHFLGNSKTGKPAYDLVRAYRIHGWPDDDTCDRTNIPVDALLGGKVAFGDFQAVHGHVIHAQPNDLPINLTYELALAFHVDKMSLGVTWLKKKKYDCIPELETQMQLLVEKALGRGIAMDDLFENENSVDILTIGNAEAKYLKNLLALLHDSYAIQYEKWFKVICAIAHTSPSYKPLAHWFSQRVPDKWAPGEVDRVWDEALRQQSDNPVTKRSIIYWARESSPQKFQLAQKENYIEVLAKYVYQNEGRVEHSQVAHIVHAMVSDKFVVDVGKCDGRLKYNWYEYVVPGQSMRKGEIFKWRLENSPDNIHLFISRHLPKIYTEQTQRIRDRREGAQSEEESKYWASVEKTFRMYMSKLYNDGFQRGIIQQAQYVFRQRGFVEELDSYQDVIGVGNGILRTGPEPKLIKGFHEYKISRYTETDYVPYNPEDPIQREILRWSRDIYPEKDVWEFMWFNACTGLDLHESACILVLNVGGGQNGKTSWANMIHNTLGNDYCASGKSALLVGSMERGESANSAQMHMRGKTWFYFDEFTKLCKLNDARLKGIVTAGWQSGRDLHEKQSNFKNTCNPVAFSNFDFTIETTDHGTWRRIYYYKSKAKFSKTPNPNSPYEKKADLRWESRNPNDPAYRAATLAILTHFNGRLWREYDGDLKNIPVPTIDRETEAFRNRQDLLNKFITQMIVTSPGCKAVSLQTIGLRYSEWHAKHIRTGGNFTGIESEIENSRLSKYLQIRAGGMKYLIDCRIKDDIDDKPEEGEEYLIQILPEAEAMFVENDHEDSPHYGKQQPCKVAREKNKNDANAANAQGDNRTNAAHDTNVKNRTNAAHGADPCSMEDNISIEGIAMHINRKLDGEDLVPNNLKYVQNMDDDIADQLNDVLG